MIPGSVEPFAYQTSNILTSPLPSPSSIRWPPDWPHNNKLVKLPHCRVPGPTHAPRQDPGICTQLFCASFSFFRTHRPTIKYVYYTTGGKAGRPFQRLSGSLSRADGSTARYLPPLPALKECACVCAAGGVRPLDRMSGVWRCGGVWRWWCSTQIRPKTFALLGA